MINLIFVLLNVSSLVIPQLIRDTVVIVMFFTTTLLVLMSHLLSLFPIFFLMRLSTRLPLSPMSCLFRCLFHISQESVVLPPSSTTPLQVYTRWLSPSALAPPPSSFPSSDSLSLASDSLSIALRKGTRSCTTKHPISQFVSSSSLSPSHSCFISHFSTVSTPKTMQDALSSSG